MMSHRVRAIVMLRSTDDGGLRAALPSGTRSLLLQFVALDDPDGRVQLGAVVARQNRNGILEPGNTYSDIELSFWADEARLYATANQEFCLWYGRVVGEGNVLEVVA